jgi:hypothetical protein
MNKLCTFWKKESSNCKTAKASNTLPPEWLGDKEHILPHGIVCDCCNNYFASGIEQPVLEPGHFVTARLSALIPKKREKMPVMPAMLLPATRSGGLHFQIILQFEFL